jgi:hypothetical protein
MAWGYTQLVFRAGQETKSVVDRIGVLEHKVDAIDGKLDFALWGYGPAAAAEQAGREQVTEQAASASAGVLEPYRIPEYARAMLGSAAGVPWSAAQRISSMNRFTGDDARGMPRGLVKHSFQIFRTRSEIQAITYETNKFDVCADGGKQRPGDTFQSGTSLSDEFGHAFNADEFPYLVLPMPKPNVTCFQDYGLRLGDLGLVLWSPSPGVIKGKAGMYCDHGPWWRVGEGSVAMASAIGVNPDPVRGGVQGLKPGHGVMHLMFPGSHERRNDKRSTLKPPQIAELVAQYYKTLTGHDLVLP